MSRRLWLFSFVFVATFVAYIAFRGPAPQLDSVPVDEGPIAETAVPSRASSGVLEGAAPMVQPAGERIDVAGVEKSVALVRPRTSPSDEKGYGIELKDLGTLGIDDRIAFYVPQENVEYEGRVTELKATAAGNKVIVGSLFEEGRPFRFVFTVGARQTFGTLHTPHGRYQFETRDGIGRIVSTRTLREELDYSQPDYVIPELKQIETQERVRPG